MNVAASFEVKGWCPGGLRPMPSGVPYDELLLDTVKRLSASGVRRPELREVATMLWERAASWDRLHSPGSGDTLPEQIYQVRALADV